MENITFELINKLRKQTGRGLMDCKKALQNSDTFEEAQKFLRKQGSIAILRMI